MGATFCPVQAQDTSGTSNADQGNSILEEIIITSRRYEESSQDVPLAVNVFNTDFLNSQHVKDVNDIMSLTPGATMTFFNKVNPEASMRGLQTSTSGNAMSDSSILLLVDDVVVSKDFMHSRPIYDIDRVEVLRGPQGTAFGRNASIGAVNIITRRPTRKFEAGIEASTGQRNLFESKGYISGPLSDTLAARFAYNFDSSDGEAESASTGKGLDGKKNFAFRGSLFYEPTDTLNVFFKAEYFEDNNDAPVRRSKDCSIPQILDAANPLRVDQGGTLGLNMPPFPKTFIDPCDTFETEISPGNFFFNRQILTLEAEIAWELVDGITLTSISGYMDGQSKGFQDALGTPQNILFQVTDNNGESFTQEIRIDNHASGNRFLWLAGFFYLGDEEDRFEENQFFQLNADGSGGLPFPRVPTRIGSTQKGNTDAVGVFAELSYDITSRLNLTFGARWGRDEKDMTTSTRGFGFAPVIAGLEGCVVPPMSPPVCGTQANPLGFAPVSATKAWDDLMFKSSVQYAVTDNHMIYFTWSQGFKPGGFQPDPRTTAAALLPFGAERTNNYELGWKGEFAGQFRFAIDGFFTRLKDTQVNQFIQAGTGFFQLFSNAGAVESIGVEGDLTWVVTPDFRLNGTFATMDVELKKTILNTALGGGGSNFSGTRPDGAAKWTATAFAEYDFHLPGGSTLNLRTDLTARSNIFDDIGELPDRKRPSLAQIGARATWTSADRHFDVSVWGRDLNEDEDILNIGPNQANTLQPPILFSNRRLIGGTIGYHF